MARVLIVDDDVAALAAARQAVRAAGHEPVAVASAAEARAALESSAPPEVLLVAPGADGGDALALAAATHDRGGLPLVLVMGAPSGAAGAAPASLPVLAAPLVPGTVSARIAEGLAERERITRAAPAPQPQPPQPASAEEPRRRPAPRSSSVEATLRALFRRPGPNVSPPLPPPPPPPAPQAPAPVAAAAAPARRAAGERPEPAAARATPRTPASTVDLNALHTLARTGDYFAVLGLPRDAAGPHVRSAASLLLNELDAARLAAGPDAVAVLDEIRQVIVDARDVLGDDARRGRYLRAIDRPGRG